MIHLTEREKEVLESGVLEEIVQGDYKGKGFEYRVWRLATGWPLRSGRGLNTRELSQLLRTPPREIRACFIVEEYKDRKRIENYKNDKAQQLL